MRTSRYTVSVGGLGGKRLLYNTTNGAFAAVDETTFGEFEAAAGTHAGRLLEEGFLAEPSRRLIGWYARRASS